MNQVVRSSLDYINISKEEADLISELTNKYPQSELAEYYLENYLSNSYTLLSTMGIHDFMTAIYCGYKVIETPEDKIRDMFTEYTNEIDISDDYDSNDMANLIVKVLNTLLIKIEGVNV